MRETAGMDDDEGAKILGLLPELSEQWVRQLLSVDVGQDLHALKAELGDAAFELFRGLTSVGHRHAAEAYQPVGALRHELGDPVIDDLRCLYGDVERHSIVALRRRRL